MIAQAWWWLWLLPAAVVFSLFIMAMLVWRGPQVAVAALVDCLDHMVDTRENS